MALVLEPVNAVGEFKECRREGGTLASCTTQTAKTLAIATAAEASSTVAHAVTVLDAVEYVQECRANHPLLSCQAGAIVHAGTEKAMNGMATALTVGAPATPAWPIALGTAVVATQQSKRVGRTFGDVTVKLVDYLIDNVPAEVIDASSALSLQQAEHQVVVFQPSDVAMIKSLVKVNQDVGAHVVAIRSGSDQTVARFERAQQRLESKVAAFNEHSRNVEIKLEHELDLVKSLEESRRNLRVNMPELAQRLDTRYHDLNLQADAHNRNPARDTHAQVTYDDGDWRIGFKVTYAPGGMGGGGFSCAIL